MTTTTEALSLARDALESLMDVASDCGASKACVAMCDARAAIAAMDSLAQQHATDIDEAQLARLHAIGAVAWAGVDPQALRDGWQASLPADMRDAFEHWTATQCSDCTNYTIWKAACAWVLQQPSVPSAEPLTLQLWCETCEGTGQVHQEHQRGVPGSGGMFDCPDCDGNGYIKSLRYALAGVAPPMANGP